MRHKEILSFTSQGRVNPEAAFDMAHLDRYLPLEYPKGLFHSSRLTIEPLGALAQELRENMKKKKI